MNFSENHKIKIKDPLHGVTLEMILNFLVDRYGWEKLGEEFNMRCFMYEPSIKSCLYFLRRTPWARKKVENFYAREVKSSSSN